MVKIRLRRVGAKKQPSYRIVVTDNRTARDGRFIEVVGHYNPRTDPPTVVVKEDRALYWLSVGAQPSDPVQRFFDKLGLAGKLKEYRATGGKSAEPAKPVANGKPATKGRAKAAPVAEVEAAPAAEVAPVAEVEVTPAAVAPARTRGKKVAAEAAAADVAAAEAGEAIGQVGAGVAEAATSEAADATAEATPDAAPRRTRARRATKAAAEEGEAPEAAEDGAKAGG